MAAIPDGQSVAYRAQIFSICREAFEEKTYGRHFTDAVLLARIPEIGYITAIVERNLEHLPLDHVLVAVGASRDEVCGFTAVGERPGLLEDTYTQLLSAVRRGYRGHEVYYGLSALLAEALPLDVTLINVVQAENLAIQRAYQGSGRVPLADSVVLRRV